MTRQAPHIRATPAIREWPALLEGWSLTEEQKKDREAFGLPTDRPIVMTGHQPVFWHPGILVKYLVAQAVAERVGGVASWLVVDQDAVDPSGIEVPIRDEAGDLVARPIRLTEGGDVDGSPRSIVPRAASDFTVDGEPALPELTTRLRAMGDALDANLDAPSLATQAVRANFQLLDGVLPPAPTIYASGFRRMARFGEIVERMRRDPARAVHTYNDAARTSPEAHVAPLRMNEDEELFELPLWAIDGSGKRQRSKMRP